MRFRCGEKCRGDERSGTRRTSAGGEVPSNRCIREVYLSEHNARFALAPAHPETAFVADRAGVHRDRLCVQEERVVGTDNTVRYRGLSLQIPPSPIRPHFVKVRGRGHDYPDGTRAIFHGPRRLAR